MYYCDELEHTDKSVSVSKKNTEASVLWMGLEGVQRTMWSERRGQEEAEEEGGGVWLIGQLRVCDASGWRLEAAPSISSPAGGRGGGDQETSWEPGLLSTPNDVTSRQQLPRSLLRGKGQKKQVNRPMIQFIWVYFTTQQYMHRNHRKCQKWFTRLRLIYETAFPNNSINDFIHLHFEVVKTFVWGLPNIWSRAIWSDSPSVI